MVLIIGYWIYIMSNIIIRLVRIEVQHVGNKIKKSQIYCLRISWIMYEKKLNSDQLSNIYSTFLTQRN